MSLETKYDLIERYLNNSLSAEELALIEVRLQNDSAFADEVAAHRMTSELMKDLVAVDIKQEFKKIRAANAHKPTSKFNIGYYLSGIFVVGLIITGVLLFKKNNTNENKTDLPVAHILNEDPISGKSDTLEIENSELDETHKLKNTNTEQKSNDQVESIALTTSESYLPSQPIANNPLPIDVKKNNTTVALSAVNTGEKESEKPGTNPSSTKTPTNPVKSPCDDITIKPEYTIDQATGDITIDSKITQGNPPYQFSIDGGKNFYSQNQFKSEGLYKYLLVVMDQQNCKSEVIEVKIPTTKNYVIYPDKQKYLEISLSRFEGALVTIKIISAQTNEIVYNTYSSDNTFIWEGTDQNNNPLVTGNYVYEISSAKSSLLLSGIITIVR